MTSGHFGTVAISTVAKGDRQRKDVGDLQPLIYSINLRGLIHPIVLTRDYVLVAGERRLESCRQLGWTNITFQFVDELDEEELELIELDENLKRKDLTWQEEHNAYMKRINALTKRFPDITQEELGVHIGGLQKSTVSKHLAYEQEKTHPVVLRQIENKNTFKAASNAAVRVKELRKANDPVYTIEPFNAIYSPIITEDFTQWVQTYTGPKFNLIHCDFPYGIGSHTTIGQYSFLPVNYTDSPDTFWNLFDTLKEYLDVFCAESAHIFFWFSPNIYCEVQRALNGLEGFKFEEHPLVWQRGENEGIAPDYTRRPRRIYEMAFFGWRNDRQIFQTKANSFVSPTERNHHPHEKSEDALRHWFEMCVNSDTSIFDPTCGSGSALRAAKSLGATTILGLETNKEYAEGAKKRLG